MNLGYSFEVSSVDNYRRLFLRQWPTYAPQVSGSIYRVEGSGQSKNATKTGSDHSVLEGDVVLKLKDFFGYTAFEAHDTIPFDGVLQENKNYKSRREDQKSFTLQKEWLDQARHEAMNRSMLSVVAIKFKGTRPNIKEYQKYNWHGVDGNAVHYMVPHHDWFQLWAFLLSLIAHNDELERLVHADQQTTLADISDEALLEEVARRLSIKDPSC